MDEKLINLFKKEHASGKYSWKTYQPINIKGYEATLTLSGRKCIDRASALITHITKNFDPGSTCVDWGSNNGYFTFELAKNNYRVVGIDSNKYFTELCNKVCLEDTFKYTPHFITESLADSTVIKHPADIALCFSVLHHIDKKYAIMDKFSQQYKNAYIEMDKHNYGLDFLKIFYYDPKLICEANDPYGNSTRLRKTWFCSEKVANRKYSNLKHNNFLCGRSVFKCTNLDSKIVSVIKRENVSFGHTWLNTNLDHEYAVYKQWQDQTFIPKVINYTTTDTERVLELEYIDNNTTSGGSITQIFDWLQKNNLIIADLAKSQFLATKYGYMLVDLESIFNSNDISRCVKVPSKLSTIKTYNEQIQYLKRNGVYDK